MRILFAADVPPDPDSGAAGTEWQTMRALRELGHEVDEIWSHDLPHRIRHGNLHYLLELPGAYREVIRERCGLKDYDVIHVNQGHCYLAAREHREQRRPGVFICRSHGLDDHMEAVLSQWRKRLGISSRNRLKALPGLLIDLLLKRHDRLAYRDADGVIVSSSLDRDYLVDGGYVPAQRVACIPQAPSPVFFREPVLGMDAQRLRRVLHVGGFAYWKGVHAVAAAINRLSESPTDIQLTWVCREDEHSKVRALLTASAQAHLELIGWLPQDELLGLYDRHGIFLCPSLFEGFNKVFLEAMARGLCVIGTPTGGMRDLIASGHNGFLVGFNDPEGIVAVIRQLQSRPDQAAAISAAAAGGARAFSWQRAAHETATFYGELAAMGHR